MSEEILSSIYRFSREFVDPVSKLSFELKNKNISAVISQVLILGSIDKEGKVTLVHPSQKYENGLPIA